MRLEDALLYLVVDPSGHTADSVRAYCECAIAGGVDVIQLAGTPADDATPEDLLLSARAICQSEDALFFVENDSATAQRVEADGVLISTPESSIGHVRAMVSDSCIVGRYTHTPTDAQLAIEVGADFLVHGAGSGCPAAFAALPEATGLPLYAGAIASIDEARGLVDQGVYRLCVHSSLMDSETITAQAAEYSRLLGRSM